MPCSGKSLPEISLRNIFQKVRCISACCGGRIVIQALDIEKYLSQLYYNLESPASFAGIDSIYRAVKNDGKYQISRNKIRQWLQTQHTYTLHKPVRYRFKRNRVIVGRIDDEWEADLVIMGSLSTHNNGHKYVLTVIDVLSKYVWVEPLKSKTGECLVQAFGKIIKKGRKPRMFHTNKGTEFKGA